ncbi:DUF481 domain-containing protein [Aquimarina sp. 2201CG1-2-11]|uniref:DUF481 domain-containing protein n=1 Tax=Aquimarina discodermiae TaxID=3231043 RepID=UPI0034620E4F
MKKIIFILLLALVDYNVNAQIVNVESIRKVSDTSRWSGYANLSFDLTKNKNRIFNFKNKVHIQYLYEKNLVLVVNDINFKESNNSKLVSKGTQHIRYNYRFSNRFALEAFAQSQYDEISAIEFRGLLGTGVRFKVSKSDDYNFFMGILSMFEYERINNNLEDVIHRDFRNSTYVSFSLFPKNDIAIVSTTYYQPLYRDFEDYRLSNDTSVVINIFKNLAFNLGFTYLYDAMPALEVPKEQYKITNGLTYSFN